VHQLQRLNSLARITFRICFFDSLYTFVYYSNLEMGSASCPTVHCVRWYVKILTRPVPQTDIRRVALFYFGFRLVFDLSCSVWVYFLDFRFETFRFVVIFHIFPLCSYLSYLSALQLYLRLELVYSLLL